MKMKPLLIVVILLLLLGGGYLLTKTLKSGSLSMQMDSHNGMQGMGKNQSSSQTHGNYKLQFISSTKSLKPNEETTIKYKIIDAQGMVLKDFALDHTKLMHFIIVRKDLQDFQHIHPDFNKETGEFSIPVTFPDDGTYRLFADFAPANAPKDAMGMAASITPYQDITVGDTSKYRPQTVTPDTDMTKTVDSYSITYAIPQPIKAGQSTSIMLNVSKDGQPVTDMEEYLGAQAHGILLKKDTLDFAHLHAMGNSMTHSMGGQTMAMYGPMPKGPEIKLDYTFPASGVYKLFTQFQHQGKVITTDYTFEVK